MNQSDNKISLIENYVAVEGGLRDTDSSTSSSQPPFHELRESRRRVAFKDDTYVKYVLLFSGVIKPSTSYSLWWLCWIGWRLYILFTIIMVFVVTYGKLFQVPETLVMWYIYPLIVAMIISATMYNTLPKLLDGIETTNLNECKCIVNEADVRSATSLSIYFIGISLGLGVVSGVVRLAKTNSPFICMMDFGMECSTSPVLGAVLLALSLETCLAKKEVQTLIKSAYDKSLTKFQYLEVSEVIRKRSHRWTSTLAVLVTIAIWNSIGLVVSLEYTIGKVNIFHHGDDDVASEVQVDVLIFIALVKESILLFVLIFLIMGINDEADSITSVLLENEWGSIDETMICSVNNINQQDSGSNNNDHVNLDSVMRDKQQRDFQLELRRAHLILLSTTYAVKPQALKSWVSYLTMPKTKPISFTVCGFRISRRIALGMFLSFLAGLMNAFYKFLLYST